jgi:hypothetical protein
LEVLEGSTERFPEHVVVARDEEKRFALQKRANLFDLGLQLLQCDLFRFERALVRNHAHGISGIHKLAEFLGNGRVLQDYLVVMWLLMGPRHLDDGGYLFHT